MEKLILTYLNQSYPSAYIYRSKFGDVLYINQFTLVSWDSFVLRQLMLLFSCDISYATNVFDNWKASLCVYVMFTNATNDKVLVPFKTECNSTVS